jgi:4-amino-4-deoxy-L-arabinose transferase-like glycosyltransferase
LCFAVAWIHVQDQGGFPGNKTPRYVGIGYYLLEAAAVLCGLLLIAARPGSLLRASWLLSLAVGVGPVAGYLLSRGPGLPDYGDDRGNWLEPLGLVSLAVEGALIVLATIVLATGRKVRSRSPQRSRPGY